MNRAHVLHLLAQHKPALAERFGLVSLALFGSTARDAAGRIVTLIFSSPSMGQRHQNDTSASSSSWRIF